MSATTLRCTICGKTFYPLKTTICERCTKQLRIDPVMRRWYKAQQKRAKKAETGD